MLLPDILHFLEVWNQQCEELGLSFLDAATEYYEGDANDSEDDEECEEVTET